MCIGKKTLSLPIFVDVLQKFGPHIRLRDTGLIIIIIMYN